MLHKFRLLLLPALAILFLAACDSETNTIASIEDSSVQEETTVIEEADSEATDSEESIESEESLSEESLSEETAVEETEVLEETETAEITEEPVTKEAEKTPVVEAATPEETEDLNPNIQEAVNQLLAETSIELENYVFFFTETEEYVEIEVREDIDADATPLVGIYRYILETDELLANDYLTGEFIPFEFVQ